MESTAGALAAGRFASPNSRLRALKRLTKVNPCNKSTPLYVLHTERKMREISFRSDVLPLKNVLFRLSLRITASREEAEDVVQETLMKVWDRRADWSAIDSMEAFAMSVCRNLSLDLVRRKGRQAASIDDGGVREPQSDTDPYRQADQSNRVRIVRRLVDALPEKQRTCIHLRDFEGKSYKEVAEVMGISESQVKVNIFRARQAIKTKFEQLDQYGL